MRRASRRTRLAHLRASKPPKAGSTVRFGLTPQSLGEGFDAEVLGRAGPTTRCSACAFRPILELLQPSGHVPLPPYITHAASAEDERRYQTVFAKHPGAVAAPTAALHFDEGVLGAQRERGIGLASVTLQVGAGTFQPVRSENLAEHRMHSEWFSSGHRRAVAGAAAGRRVAAAGTTTCEHSNPPRAPRPAMANAAQRGETDIFIAGHHSSGRPADHQLPPAQEHADDAGQRIRRARPRDGAVPPCDRGPLPILQLRRRDAVGSRSRAGMKPHLPGPGADARPAGEQRLASGTR
jgi:S-adenosylmethionine:tRNA-ribosyltransferase-isomerase (queuine synthetase)